MLLFLNDLYSPFITIVIGIGQFTVFYIVKNIPSKGTIRQ